MSPCDVPGCPVHSTVTRASTAPGVSTRLVFMEDVRAGMVVEFEQTATGSTLELLTQTAHVNPRWGTVLDLREQGGVYGAVVIAEDGEQYAMYRQGIQLVRVLLDHAETTRLPP